MANPTRRESLRIAALAILAARCRASMAPAPAAHATEHSSADPASGARRSTAAAAARPETSGHSPSRARLWYRQPAREWVEALPLGSGRVGAMVFGGVESERLQLNEDTLWAGGPYRADNPDALGALAEVRRLIFEGSYRQAEELAGARMMAKPIVQMPYQSAGDVIFSFSGIGPVVCYERELSLDTAIARSSFASGGIAFTREVFASPVDQVIVARLTAGARAAIHFDLTLVPPHATRLEASAISQDAPRTEIEGPATLVLRGKNRGEAGIEGMLTFEVRAECICPTGSISAHDGVISVRGADSAVVLIAVATSYKGHRDVSGDPVGVTTRQIAAARSKSYEQLRADHVAEHRRLYGRVSIDLGTTDAALRPTDERIRDAVDDPDLAALYFQFGRYLLLGCSRPGTQPANLQGLWNDSLRPPWGCKYTININTEMNYWPAEPANLAECVEPLVDLLKDLTVTGAATARTHYGARGWVAHHNTDLWRATAPVDGARWGLWPTGGAWLCMALWEHFQYGRDQAYLAQVYPILKGAAEFFLDTLVEEPKHGWLVTCPSISPENVHPHGASLCAGPTMDEQIVRDLFTHCIDAAEILGVDEPLRQELREKRARLAPNQIGAAGQLQEWLDDWDMSAPEMHHRHVSHLYGCFPSNQIDVHTTPELAAAARRSLEIRGDEATGWGMAWRINLWARLGDGEHAYKLLRSLLGPTRTYPNLFDAHPPFQVDGNFGGVSGICEMLLQTHGGVVSLLPALPEAWPSGSILGLRARGGFGVDIWWRGGGLEKATLRGRPGAHALVRYRTREVATTLGGSGVLHVSAPAGTDLMAEPA